PFPGAGGGFGTLEAPLRLARRLWEGDEAPFVGHRLQATRPIGSPRPVSRPHPPILIGGTGERRTLRLVARYGDACNLPDVPDGGELIRRKLDVLADHCAVEDRPFDAIEKTVSTRLEPGDTVDAFVERAAALAELGMDHLIVLTRGAWTADRLAVVVSAVRAITALTPRHPIQVAAARGPHDDPHPEH